MQQLAALNDMPRRGKCIAGQPATATRPDCTIHTGIRSCQLEDGRWCWRGCRTSAVKGRRRSQARTLRCITTIRGGRIVNSRTVLGFLVGLLAVPPAMAISPGSSNNAVIISYQVRNWHGRCSTAVKGWSCSHIRPPQHVKTTINHIGTILPETCGSHRGRPISACTPRIENRLPIYRSEKWGCAGLVADHNHPGAPATFASHWSVGFCSRHWGTERLVYDTEAAWKLWRKLKDRQKHKLVTGSLCYPFGRQKRWQRISTALWTTGSHGLRYGG